jgi:hypothetical protein
MRYFPIDNIRDVSQEYFAFKALEFTEIQYCCWKMTMSGCECVPQKKVEHLFVKMEARVVFTILGIGRTILRSLAMWSFDNNVWNKMKKNMIQTIKDPFENIFMY